jgi:hypothetical protein
MNDTNTIANIRDWFETAKPVEQRSVRDIQVQAGVHFEEVHEMLIEIEGLTPETRALLIAAQESMHNLANHFKQSTDVVFIVDEDDHVKFLDSLCDQIVTATGVAHFMNYLIVPAIDEVSRSNDSKFIDGQCVLDTNGKIAKGPNYFKANLAPYT